MFVAVFLSERDTILVFASNSAETSMVSPDLRPAGAGHRKVALSPQYFPPAGCGVLTRHLGESTSGIVKLGKMIVFRWFPSPNVSAFTLKNRLSNLPSCRPNLLMPWLRLLGCEELQDAATRTASVGGINVENGNPGSRRKGTVNLGRFVPAGS